MKKWLSILLFVIGLAAAIAFNVVRHALPLYQVVLLKMIPTLMMAAWIVLIKVDKYNIYILIGIVFSMLGDVCMELPGETYFLIGIGTNTLGVVFYTLFFYFSDRSGDWIRLIPVAIVMGVFYIILYDYTAALALPVLGYCVIHTLFLWRSSARFGEAHISPSSQWVCFIGCVCVTISDFLLSLTVFGIIPNEPKFQVTDMVLWWSGLFMLTITAEIRRRRLRSLSAAGTGRP